MKVLLDTNAYTAFRRGDEAVVALVQKAERLVMSAIVVGELLFGFHAGSRFGENLDSLEEFLDAEVVDFVPVSLDTAHRFGILSRDLRRAGTPIPTNDVWIAAHVQETGSHLLSLDGHFDRIAGLPRLSVGPTGPESSS